MCHIQADVKCGIRGYKQRMGGAIACPLVKSTKKDEKCLQKPKG